MFAYKSSLRKLNGSRSHIMSVGGAKVMVVHSHMDSVRRNGTVMHLHIIKTLFARKSNSICIRPCTPFSFQYGSIYTFPVLPCTTLPKFLANISYFCVPRIFLALPFTIYSPKSPFMSATYVRTLI